MRFAKLRLTGFKSFVDPTDLLIAPGLTGVVGPNGCGKSNLLEALRWVMGESRARAMRGAGMEDVIFAGVASRPARNFAEVSLTIDNFDRLAPTGFNEKDVLEVTRRITRDLGSAYKVNGKETRARDVQMLFADAATGAASPALVRQGQISQMINARPKDRRKVLEDAAGIGGLYQRRHEAELRLKNTEANLLRVDDLIEQLAQQISALARQARQAARYRAIAEELRRTDAMLLYRHWRAADLASNEMESTLRKLLTEAAQTEALALQARKQRETCDSALPALREEEAIAAAVLQRHVIERDSLGSQENEARNRIKALDARIGQLAQDLERETELNRDAGQTINRLETETRDLSRSLEGQEERLASLENTVQSASETLRAHETELAGKTEEMAGLMARHQSAQRHVQDCQAQLARSETQRQKAEQDIKTAQGGLEQANEAARKATLDYEQQGHKAEQAEQALNKVASSLQEAQASEAKARAVRSEYEGVLGALRSESAALTRLLGRSAGSGEQILDQVRIERGYEKALGAALADDLTASQVNTTETSGWHRLTDYPDTAPLPAGVTPLANHMQAPQVLTRRIAQIGLCQKEDGPKLQENLRPGQRLVSREGDLWRWDGLYTRAKDQSSAAALRLEQINRHDALVREMAEQEAEFKTAQAAHDKQVKQLEELSSADKTARAQLRAADQALALASRMQSRALTDADLAQNRMETARLAQERLSKEIETAQASVMEAQEGLGALGDLDLARAGVGELRMKVEAARAEMMRRKSDYDARKREGTARRGRLGHVTRELSDWRRRSQSATAREAELADRKQAAQAELDQARLLPGELASKKGALSAGIEMAQARKDAAAEALARAETQTHDAIRSERDAQRAASEAREARAGAQARRDSLRETASQALQRIADELECSPDELLTRYRLSDGEIAPIERLEQEITRLKRQRDALGAVNLRAEEDAREIEIEYETLTREKNDLEEAIKTLRGGIYALNREGRERLLSAFEQVNANFTTLFTHLFGGGEASLMMVESDDPLEAGLEIMCQPPGKKLSTLSLLSGGEQTLTALALIFAVFLANPSPICVLDEVDAPLDDANVTRFCDMLDEMTRRTQTRFMIITHHAVTMARMDRLFGVTMQEQGVSQLVSVDLKRAERLVA